MALAPRLEIRQGQSLVMTPQLQQAIKLLQLSNIELSNFVEQELEKNPLLTREDGEGDNAGSAEAASANDTSNADLMTISCSCVVWGQRSLGDPLHQLPARLERAGIQHPVRAFTQLLDKLRRIRVVTKRHRPVAPLPRIANHPLQDRSHQVAVDPKADDNPLTANDIARRRFK